MTVFRRGKKLVIDYWPEGRHGKRVRKTLPESFQDEEEAKLIEEDLKRASRAPEDIALPSGTTVLEAFPSYIAWYELHRAKSTAQDLKWTWEAHIKRILGEYRVAEINSNHINLYKRIRKAEGVKPKKKKDLDKNEPKLPLRMVSNRTINKELSLFSAFLTWCQREHKIKRELAAVEMLPYKRPLPMPMSFDECMKVIDAAEPIYQAYILCLFFLGLRKAEARNIRKSDIDRTNHTIKVVQKGGSEKVLPAGKWLVSVLDLIEIDDKRNPDGYIFFNYRKGKPIQNYRKALIRAAAKAQVFKRVTPHVFRHSIGKFLVDRNINLRIIQKYLGHQRVSTTEIYTQVELASLREAEKIILKGIESFYRKKQQAPRT